MKKAKAMPGRVEPDVMPVGYYHHKFLGTVKIDDACQEMQRKNSDQTSIFVVNNREIIEVTRFLIKPSGEYLK